MSLHKRLTHFGIALVSIWLAMALYQLLQGVTGLLTLHHYQFTVWRDIRANTLNIWMPLLPLTPLVFWFASRYPFQSGFHWPTHVKHLGMMVMFALLHGYLAAQLYYHFGYISEDMVGYQPWQHAGHFLFQNNVFLIDALIYSILVASQNLSLFHQLVRQNEMDRIRIEGQLAEARLQALKMQINPHFLFNTLNSIAVLVKKQESAKAEAMIARLSDYFRQTLEQGEASLVPLRQELALVEQYLAIEMIRFGERFTVEYRIETACLADKVPVLILQPLVENAIKHGLGKKTGACHLVVSANKTAEGLLLGVSDDGAGADQSVMVGGVGLRNVQARLQALYAGRHQFVFDSTPGVGTAVYIQLATLQAATQ